MTIEQAKFIISTYKLPMTKEQEELYKKALKLVSTFPLRKPNE